MKSTESIKRYVGILATIVFIATACKQSMVISRVDYAQPIESVLTPDEQGMVKEVRQGLSFNIKPLQYIETNDTSSVTTNQIRYIRDVKGYYYITAPDYKNVYVMTPESGALKLKTMILIAEDGIEKPAFNQRDSYIQLLDITAEESWRLTSEGIQEASKITNTEGQ